MLVIAGTPKNCTAFALSNRRVSVGLAENAKLGSLLPTKDALTLAGGLLQRDTTQSGFRSLLDLLLALGISAPVAPGETLLYCNSKLVKVLGFKRVGFAEGERAVKQRFLDLSQGLLNGSGHPVLRNEALPLPARPIAAGQDG